MKVTIDRELLERAASMELDTTDRSIRIRDEIRAILAAQPAQQDEAVRVVGWLGGNGLHAEESMASGAPFPLMTVAQHNRILADMRQQRDKLAELLREAKSAYTTAIHWTDMRATMAKIDAALSELTP